MDISSVEFPSDPIKVVYCLNRIEIRLQYQFIVCECLLNCSKFQFIVAIV